MNIERFQQLIALGLSLDHLFILEQVKEGLDISGLENAKIQALYQSLIRKNLIIDDEISKDGENILKLGEGTEVIIVSKKEKSKEFDEWWLQYPGTDTFVINNRTFKGSRALRVKKEDCKTKFYKILAEGFTTEELIAALNYEVNQKKDNSLKTGENKLKFMQNSLTYLNQRTWEPYVELLKQGFKEDKKEDFEGVNI